jgi:hypothetical protein
MSDEASPDSYASEYMKAGRVLLRDKRVAPRYFQLMMLIPGVFFTLMMLGGVGMVASGTAGNTGWMFTGLGAAMTAMFAFGWLTNSVLRTLVSESELYIQCGFMGPRIPIERIESIGVRQQRNRLRIGKRFEEGMWTSSYLFALGDYVDVVFRDDSNRQRRVAFTPSDPAAVVAAVERAQAGRVRVEVAETESQEEELLAEAEQVAKKTS